MSEKYVGIAPLPWSWEINEDDQRLLLWDAEGNVLGQLYDRGAQAEADAICNAMNGQDALRPTLDEAQDYIDLLKQQREVLWSLVEQMMPFVKMVLEMEAGKLSGEKVLAAAERELAKKEEA